MSMLLCLIFVSIVSFWGDDSFIKSTDRKTDKKCGNVIRSGRVANPTTISAACPSLELVFARRALHLEWPATKFALGGCSQGRYFGHQ